MINSVVFTLVLSLISGMSIDMLSLDITVDKILDAYHLIAAK
jgi:hypothetical protein